MNSSQRGVFAQITTYYRYIHLKQAFRMSHQGVVTARPSMFSLNGSQSHHQTISRPAIQSRRTSSQRICDNCTCSPGLLTRLGRLSNKYQRRMSLRRSSSGKIQSVTSSPRRQNSLYTIDAESSNCDRSVKEINTSQRLESLRSQMAKHDLAVYVIPSEDAHQSEYTSASDQRRSFISGFSGSAGVAVVTRDITSLNDTPDGLCVLSTDGRYFNQAANELDFNWRLLKQFTKGEPTWEEWSILQLEQMSLDSGKVAKIGIDPKLITYSAYKGFQLLIDQKVSLNAKVSIVPVEQNLIDAIWTDFESLPPKTLNDVGYLDVKYTGLSTLDKKQKIKDELTKYNATTLVVTALDEIAWFLNLRGNDIEFNPVFYSYLLLNGDEFTLYSDKPERFSNLDLYFSENKIELKPYDQIFGDLKDIPISSKVVIPETASWAIVNALSNSNYQVTTSPIDELKLLKTKEEIDGAISAHYKDGIALCKYFAWLEHEIGHNCELIDEVEASDKQELFRKEQENFVGLSFETISSTGPNAAIIHYAPKRDDCSVINPNKIYLNDSGAQFLEGTTDTTRTLHFATPSQEEIDNYTLVLKGNIALATLTFPEGTTGFMIDSIARQYLWKYGLDYRHGTGHGIGAYLNVHEGPIGISFRPSTNRVSLKPGNLISNEPGFYKDGEYGIRIENVMYVKEADLSFGDKKFYKFETITRVPFCKKLINKNLLTLEEKSWINDYHKTIWEQVGKNFEKGSHEYKWLKHECCPI